MQYFKGDETELKFSESGTQLFESLDLSRKDFFENSFSAFSLGSLIWDSGRSPLSNAIPREIFRTSFSAIFEVFLEAGSLEGYISIFKSIFGDSCITTFEIVNPGHLKINIVASGIEIYDLSERLIVNDEYVFNEIIDQEGDDIQVRTIKGMESESEVNQMLFELVPSGIYTQINLTLGS